MRLDTDRIKDLCAARGLSLSEMLDRARVSRTAYYSLARRESVLPGSVRAIADRLGVDPSQILSLPDADERRRQVLLRIAKRVLRKNPRASFDNVWHTLMLLEERPVDRLRRSLLRGRGVDTD